MSVLAHLGGHAFKTWVDEGVLKWVKEKFGVKSMVDIGCGPGGMKKVAQDLNIRWFGIDGDPDLKKRDYIFAWDFTKGVPPLSNFTWDLGWSVEFLEHVEEQYIPNYMEVFQKCRYVVCTAAPPGWGGHHHVNEQDYLYWIDKFREYGFQLDNPMTQEMKEYSTMQEHSKGSSFMKRTGMFFKRI